MGRALWVGNQRMMVARGFSPGWAGNRDFAPAAELRPHAGAVDGQVAGIIGVADTVKDGSVDAIAQLHHMGFV